MLSPAEGYSEDAEPRAERAEVPLTMLEGRIGHTEVEGLQEAAWEHLP